MALQGDFTDSNTEVTVSDAYFRVVGISGGKTLMGVNLECWQSEATRLLVDEVEAEDRRYPLCVLNYDFVPDLDGVDNFIKQAYEYIKALPEYTGYTDV